MKKGVFVLAVSILFLFLLIFIFSDTPLRTIYFFFIGPFRTLYSLGNMLNASTPFIFGALGIIIAMKTGNLNLGGEGQVYLGAFVTTQAALTFCPSNFFGAVIAVLTGVIASGLLSAFSGFCKAKWNTPEIITTFLLSCAVIPIINYFVTGPSLDPETSLISTKKIAESMRLPLILKPSNLSAGLFIAFVFVFMVNFFLYKTKRGYEFRIAGNNEMFARYGGINTKLNTVIAMAASGALYGLAGSIAILGTHYAVIKDFSSGLGWSGLTAALIAGFSPAAVIPCSLFLAWTEAGARIAMQNTGLTIEISYIIQAVIFFFSTSLVVKNFVEQKRSIKWN
jgi:simple sugar transport system permease protein